MIRNFSFRQRLNFLLELLYGEGDERMRQDIKCLMLLSLRVQICLLSLVEFLCLAWRNDAVWFLYLVSVSRKNSILIHKHIPWQKKGNTTFDETMGSYDGAETYELVGSFLLSQLQDLNINVGLYRDDGLAITNATPKDTENIKKEICRIFNNNGLRITIEANKK